MKTLPLACQPAFRYFARAMEANSPARSRFTELVVAIVLLVVALVWAERVAWNQITALRRDNDAFIQTLKSEDAAEAQRFIAAANRTLTRLQYFLSIAVVGVLASGATIILLAYRRMIAPMRTTITESRATIERQEKLASLGVFAAGIAHEIRNPLTAIKVRLFSLKQNHQAGSPEHEDVQVIDSEIDRLEGIVREFLQFARPADPDLQDVPVKMLFQPIQQLLERDLAQKGIALEANGENDHVVRVDPNKFKQVLLNLVQNGAESIKGPGKVVLRSQLSTRLLRGRMRSVMLIRVSDTGAGISAEQQKRLFDPFFSTKEKGTGLGLPIAARIVEKHGGALECQTTPGKGTTFTIILPRDNEK
ncbi:MAG TPA: ATP-binding protein [Verrucomicrobiae bacterium]|nr:ATP-binding protein [Verrucomicrobiae bacterium]